jgi:uncharacterized membrane protein
MSNVRPFIPKHARGGGPRAEAIGHRILVAVSYLLLGYYLRVPGEAQFNVLLVLGLLYWGLVHQRRHQIPEFLRFHWLQALLLFLMLYVVLNVLFAVLALAVSTLTLLGLKPLFGVTLETWPFWFGIFHALAMFCPCVVLALAALLGKSPSVPLVSQQARYWS